MEAAMDDLHLKNTLKTALIEVMQERPDLIRQVVEQTLEDIALVSAISEGSETDTVAREEVFAILKSIA